jgi:BirA family transcriptional regulator, biotin operon repressor / biotin---[acetyl-CoA-carboxylase] ligase
MREALDSHYVKAALITVPSPWQVVDVHASIDSTNLEALRDPCPWRVVVADYQSAGRGRLTRQWLAPAGTSIAVSAVVPMPVGRTADVGWLPLLSGMAMRLALADVARVAARLKWPNDVMAQEGTASPAGGDVADGGSAGGGGGGVRAGGVRAGGGGVGVGSDGGVDGGLAVHGSPWLKLSGILCETVPGAELVVIGAGANVTQQRGELAVETATSLALCGAGDVRREDLIVRYLGQLAGLYRTWSAGGAGLEGLRAEYRSACLTIGLEVDVHQPDGSVARGTATGVDDVGRLVVTAAGTSRAHAAGDVVHVRRAQPDAGDTA